MLVEHSMTRKWFNSTTKVFLIAVFVPISLNFSTLRRFKPLGDLEVLFLGQTQIQLEFGFGAGRKVTNFSQSSSSRGIDSKFVHFSELRNFNHGFGLRL
jgi:hypothetical protein